MGASGRNHAEELAANGDQVTLNVILKKFYTYIHTYICLYVYIYIYSIHK